MNITINKQQVRNKTMKAKKSKKSKSKSSKSSSKSLSKSLSKSSKKSFLSKLKGVFKKQKKTIKVKSVKEDKAVKAPKTTKKQTKQSSSKSRVKSDKFVIVLEVFGQDINNYSDNTNYIQEAINNTSQTEIKEILEEIFMMRFTNIRINNTQISVQVKYEDVYNSIYTNDFLFNKSVEKKEAYKMDHLLFVRELIEDIIEKGEDTWKGGDIIVEYDDKQIEISPINIISIERI